MAQAPPSIGVRWGTYAQLQWLGSLVDGLLLMQNVPAQLVCVAEVQ